MFWIICYFLYASLQYTEADCPQIIGRKEWDAIKAPFGHYLQTPLDLVIIQHTVTHSCSDDLSCVQIVRDLQKTHIEQSFLWDVGASFLVGGTGKLYEGRGWHHVAIHTSGYNNQSIGIAFIGNFNNQEPSVEALNAVKALIQCGVDEELLTPDHKVVVHSQLLSTESPGKKLASKIMSWADWTNDVSEIKKRVDKLEGEPIDQESKTETDLVLASPKEIDVLSNIRDVIAELIKNMSKIAQVTVNTIEALSLGVNKEASLFIETLASELKKLRDQVLTAFSALPGIPEVQKCAKSLTEKANSLYDHTETNAKNCGDQKLKEIDDLIKNLGTLSSNALDYTITATETTKNCTELNYGIAKSTRRCLKFVEQETENASQMFESERTTMLDSINTLLAALPAALDLCAKQHLLEAGTETTKIVLDISQCATGGILPNFGGFGR